VGTMGNSDSNGCMETATPVIPSVLRQSFAHELGHGVGMVHDTPCKYVLRLRSQALCVQTYLRYIFIYLYILLIYKYSKLYISYKTDDERVGARNNVVEDSITNCRPNTRVGLCYTITCVRCNAAHI